MQVPLDAWGFGQVHSVVVDIQHLMNHGLVRPLGEGGRGGRRRREGEREEGGGKGGGGREVGVREERGGREGEGKGGGGERGRAFSAHVGQKEVKVMVGGTWLRRGVTGSSRRSRMSRMGGTSQRKSNNSLSLRTVLCKRIIT